MDASPQALWPLALYTALAIGLIAGLLGLSHLLGQRHREPATGDPFEGGIVHIGSGRPRFPVRFYLVAVLFVIFDLEAVYIFAWAVAAREVGWAGYIEILIFIGILGAALVYLWRVGALDWWRGRGRETGAGPAVGGASGSAQGEAT